VHDAIRPHTALSYQQPGVQPAARASAAQARRGVSPRWAARLPPIVLPMAIYVGYVAVAGALLTRVVVGRTEFQGAGSTAAEPPARPVSATRLVLTITVDGPIGPLKLYCDTTSDRVISDQANVSAAEVVEFYQSVCEHPQSL
jgi:hypothetical protein